jgi:hypothetical protein
MSWVGSSSSAQAARPLAVKHRVREVAVVVVGQPAAALGDLQMGWPASGDGACWVPAQGVADKT